jgi:hypothetical protein
VQDDRIAIKPERATAIAAPERFTKLVCHWPERGAEIMPIRSAVASSILFQDGGHTGPQPRRPVRETRKFAIRAFSVRVEPKRSSSVLESVIRASSAIPPEAMML